MKAILYAGGEYVTGDDIALALMEYSRRLAEEDTAGTVEIPILNADGSLGAATFLLGPASQIVAQDVDTDSDELRDPDALSRIRRLTAALQLVAQTDSEPSPSTWTDHGI
ncbi:hypothetical protein NQ152_07675 [Microbacterium sp. zg.B48]|uniref:hypothetical protein n=1 Tax=unclassified Microbacterium TaxID=2609290 RepID=UPI00214B07DF|nr:MULTISPECIES: hypothetical protein [unclassified Microbacterium]MCR2763388.1 hypothetical protein [Microbacterium sp. zg.B48]MCR2809109.1 hypothetical protein [Microbacterium sp. zg.B185]WIM20262.1 hypothetical protein QNO12_05520 [Microbacterium sp. zg-B185]